MCNAKTFIFLLKITIKKEVKVKIFGKLPVFFWLFLGGLL